METCKFVFDIIVTHLESPIVKLSDPSKLQVVANFNNVKVPLTASRINVTEFKSGAGIELNVVPKKLRKTIGECGMPISVAYNARVIGTGSIFFPERTIDQIVEGMSDLMFVESCKFEKDGEVIGQLEVLCRLIIKCDEPPVPGQGIGCRNLDKTINQQDIMFVMSESQRCPSPCDPCLDTWEPEEGDERLKLDLQRYRSSSAGGFRPKENIIHSPAGNAACCQLKKMAQECEQIVDSITKSFGHPKPLKSPCRRPDYLDGPCNDPGYAYQEEIQPSGSYLPCFSYLPAVQGKGPDFCDPELIVVPIGDEQKPEVKPIRFCPVCLANMSWLPTFAACPNCGVKPMPIVEERHKEKKLTPDQIIDEFLGKSVNINYDYCADPCDKTNKRDNDDDNKGRCTCKCGKLCAHCRTRQQCADIFQAKNEVCPKVMPKSSEDFCVREDGTKECRPYLQNVFSELRDLYDVKDVKKEPEVNRESTLMLSKKKSHQQTHVTTKRASVEKHTINDRPHVALDRKLPVFGAGHKTCLNKDATVSRRHGWAWSLRDEASKNGWRPGSVRKSVKKIMKYFLQYSADNNAFNKCKKQAKSEIDKENQLPTLNVSKKNGEILVTLRAFNNSNVDMQPIVFRVIKSDLAVALREIKKKLKSKGFPKCTCHNTVMMCVCRHLLEKKHLEYALQKECKRRGMENCVDHLVLTDTSETDIEFDFNVTPPAGVAMPPSSPKRRTVNNGTQYVKKDLIVPPKYPVTLDPYWRAYDCAAGDRYTGTAFGAPGEAVFEDGVFGHGGGGPHGPSATPGLKAKPAGIWGARPGGPMRGGGRVGPGGVGGGKSFPGTKKKPAGPSVPIPVRMPKRHIEGLKQAAQAKKDAIKKKIEKKMKGIDTMKYLMEKGTVATPWNPNDPKPAVKTKTGPVVGPDGLTESQRKRRALNQMCIPPLDSMPRLGKGYDPCQCFDSCGAQCCFPCCYC